MLKEAPPLVYVVGDVHGCFSLYSKLEALILRDSAHCLPGARALIVLLGDLVDRGPKSAQMLDLVLGPAPEGAQRLALAGNHEEMFQKFLVAPRPDAPWLEYGGRETLNSYGIYPPNGQNFSELSARRLGRMVATSVPQDHMDGLARLPVSLRLPRYLISHAGIDVHKPLNEQSEWDLMWSDPAELDQEPTAGQGPVGLLDLAAEGMQVVHGHVPAADPFEHSRRLSIDTGAYATGTLCAVRLTPRGAPLFLRV